jgi:hypothetical protein
MPLTLPQDSTNYVVAPDGSISFGVDGVVTDPSTAALGFVQSATFANAADKFEGRDENGNVAAVVLYNQNGELSCNVLLKGTATLPA